MSPRLKPLIPLGIFFGSLAVGYIALAWTAPTSTPPNNNVAAPINVSGNAQYKTGNLYIGGSGSSAFPLRIIGNGTDTSSLWVDGASELAGNTSVGSSGGNIQICLNGSCITGWPSAQGIPSGFVGYFNLTSCPSGWSALASADGRYIVGKSSNTNIGTTVGTQLSNLESRPTGQHTISVDPPNTAVNISISGGGNTSITSGGGHEDTSYGGPYRVDPTGGPSASGSVDIPPFNVTAGSVPGTNAPYIQLLVCQKN